jgi:hypothetical protein
MFTICGAKCTPGARPLLASDMHSPQYTFKVNNGGAVIRLPDTSSWRGPYLSTGANFPLFYGSRMELQNY